ncbi:MAG: DNRLRE domain-containing protein [Pseudarcicella sp.]|nr:DNRLRE domain-containing protein [Pseudarcicella sp.]MBP6411192.1 DNRLRE domain-containing protein [Pseudarcicella sp.]
MNFKKKFHFLILQALVLPFLVNCSREEICSTQIYITPKQPLLKTLILQHDEKTGKYQAISSIKPVNHNDGEIDFFHPYTWTQNGIINTRRCYLEFDMSSIKTNAIIDSAKLSLYYSTGQLNITTFPLKTHTGDNELMIQRVIEPWSAKDVDWVTQPNTSLKGVAYVESAKNETQDFLNINVSAIVKAQHKTKNYGFCIRHKEEEPYKITLITTFKEANPERRPKLEIFYHEDK